ncbi:MAG TPA: ABC transporter substrate-binding protein [Thermoanaerobaculia bacterium]
MRSPRVFRRCIVILTSVALLACRRETIPQNIPRKHPGRPVARIGYVPIAVALPLFVAVDNGYFRDEGVDVQLIRINTSNDLGTAGTLGRVDFMMPCALNVIFDIAHTTGIKHKLFGVNVYSDRAPHIADYLVVKHGSEIKKLTDLKGKRIAGHPGTATLAVLKLAFQKVNIGPNDFTFVPLQPGEWGPALTSGAVDAVAAVDPQATQLIVDGVADVLVPGFYAKAIPEMPLSGWWVADAANRRPDRSTFVVPVVNAYARAVRYISEHPEEAKRHFKNYVAISDNALPRMQLNKWLSPNEIDVSAIQQMADAFATNNVIQAKVDAKDFLYK